MLSERIMVSNFFPETEIVKRLSLVFNLESSQILALPQPEIYPDPGTASLVCLIEWRSNGFRTLLTIDTTRNYNRDYPPNIMAKIADLFCSTVLFSDDSPNCYKMNQVTPNGETSKILLDADKLDNFDEYVVYC